LTFLSYEFPNSLALCLRCHLDKYPRAFTGRFIASCDPIRLVGSSADSKSITISMKHVDEEIPKKNSDHLLI
jgi:hypothetical protein